MRQPHSSLRDRWCAGALRSLGASLLASVALNFLSGSVSAMAAGEKLSDLVRASDVILVGTVRDVSDSESGDGLASSIDVIISVERYLSGNSNSSALFLHLGDGDERSQTFESEERVLLLLESPNNTVLRKYVISGQRVEELDASLSELERKIAVYLEQPEGETLIAQKLTEPVVMDASAAAISDLTGPPMQEYHPGISKPAGIVDDAVQVAIPFLGGADGSMEAQSVAGSWVTLLAENFDSVFPSGSWSLQANTNASQAGYGYTWDDDDFKPFSGNSSAWCADASYGAGQPDLDPLVHNYPNDTKAWMKYGPFDLSDASTAFFNFKLWLDSEASYDHLMWAASTNGTNYTLLNSLSGYSAGWLQVTQKINAYAGQGQVWIAFIFESDSIINYKGAFVDDVLLRKYVVAPKQKPWVDVEPGGSITAQPGGTTSVTISNPAPSSADSLRFVIRERSATRALQTTSQFSAARPAVAFSKGGPLSGDYVPGELLVKFRENATTQSTASIHSQQGVAVLSRIDRIGVEHVRLAPGGNMATALQAYRDNPDVEYAEPNYIMTLDATPNDPSYGQLWGLHNIGQGGGSSDADIDAPEAWDRTTGTDVLVAIIDSGVDWTHPDLDDNIWTNTAEVVNGLDDDGNGYVDDVMGWDFINRDNNPMDDNHHGTHVAGTIAAEGGNGIGVVGVNWTARILPLKAGTSTGSLPATATIDAVLYAVQMGARVINASYGGPSFSLAQRDAIEVAANAGVLFVAAAGNGGLDGIGDNNDSVHHYPSDYDLPNIISVAATDQSDNLAWFSNYGTTSVDLSAPGVSILSTWPQFISPYSYNTSSGTSMATPHVAGVAALVYSRWPWLSHLSVKQLILDSIDDLPSLQGKVLTEGRLNANASLQGDDVPWISGLPISGALAPGESITVPVHFSGSASGVAFLDVYHNAGSDAGGGDLSSGRHSIEIAADVVATQLVFVTPPAPLSGTSGVTLDFSTDPVVEARDAAGRLATGFTGTVTLTETGPGTATYTNNSVAAVAGVATFSGLAVTYSGTADQESFSLQAASGALTTANSPSISSNVVATQLVFVTPPAPLSGTSGVALDFSTDPVVEAQDAAGRLDTDFTGTVTLAETGLGTATYTNNSVSAVAGVAIFAGFTTTYSATVDHETFALQASSSGVSAGSSQNITTDVVATQLAFSTQPAGSVSGLPLTTQPVVTAQDVNEVTDTDFTETVTLSETAAGSLTSHTIASVAGVATFTSLTYTALADGESFTLAANDEDAVGSNLPVADADPISSDVVATHLAFATQPVPLSGRSGTTMDFTTDPVVEARDAIGVVDTDYALTVTLTEIGPGTATHTNNRVAAQRGVATFTGLTTTYTATADERFALLATDGTLSSGPSAQITSRWMPRSATVAGTDERAPEPITELAASVLAGTVTLSWALSPSDFIHQRPAGAGFSSGGTFINANDVVRYDVWRRDDEALVRVGSVNAGETTFVDDAVVRGTSVTYRVTAADKAGNEAAPVEVNVGRLTESTVASGLSGESIVSAGAEVQIFSIGIAGDGLAGLNDIAVTISDLLTPTGLSSSDFSSLKLYRSTDGVFDGGDTEIGAQTSIAIGGLTTVAPGTVEVPASGTETYYILTALMGSTAGRSFRLGFAQGGVGASGGPLGTALVASDANRVTTSFLTESTIASGLSGESIVSAGAEVQVFSIGVAGDGLAGLNDIAVTISDLSTPTGLSSSDFSSLKLYRSTDGVFDGGDTEIGAQTSVTIGGLTTVAPATVEVPPSGTETHYVLTAVMGSTAGRSFRLGFAQGGVGTSRGPLGTALVASDANRVTIDTPTPPVTPPTTPPVTPPTTPPVTPPTTPPVTPPVTPPTTPPPTTPPPTTPPPPVSQAPLAKFSVTPTSGVAPLTVHFTNSSRNSVFNTWYLPGITLDNVDVPDDLTLTEPGVYSIRLRVYGPVTNSRHDMSLVVTVHAALAADFTVSATSGTTTETEFVFADASVGSITAWSWDFGDGGTSDLQNPSHIYSTSGVYTVSLVIIGDMGTKTKVSDQLITVTDPVPSVLSAPVTGLRAVSTGNSVVISWVRSIDDDVISGRVLGYHVYRSVEGGDRALIATTGPGTTRFRDAAGGSGVTYVYTVSPFGTDAEIDPVIVPGSAADLARTVTLGGPPTAVLATRVKARMSFDLNLDLQDAKVVQAFGDEFIALLASKLGIGASRIKITSITKGSTIVDFEIEDAASTVVNEPDAVGALANLVTLVESDVGQAFASIAPVLAFADHSTQEVIAIPLPLNSEGVPVLSWFTRGGEVVGYDDFFVFADHFGLAEGDQGFDAIFDIVANGAVDYDDFFHFADEFGTVIVNADEIHRLMGH